ncbi:transporter substrate-binding domain-containing protein [Stakelama tenebrarum]|uniref:Transporter substrate-binding domain-containing protein n=1 Tax=Stakelama tenebrarum TaxID=2711215 RepID=A0A6G6Y4N4_9SPHN|nr:transporter substrate-binding domain-containing protein [Sphingosinithalassobacter tenebrarum]QIG79875.1 transporter substrate-binding domain-containing protein [Sphingosinithalassobacter tenebrarum]
MLTTSLTALAPFRRLFAPLLLLLPLAAQAQADDRPPTGTDGALTVATREAPPFVIREPDGSWSGLAIDLWSQVAEENGIAYDLRETDLAGMVEGVADGRFDASVGALTITPGREEQVDFTHPYHTTGFGIAVDKAPPNWWILLTNFFSWGFLQAVFALSALLAIVGVFFWLAERKANAEEFGGSPRKGIFSGFWFAAVTMTTVGYGDKAPRTPAGKAVALVWMFGAILIISTFTGMIASSLTEGRLAGAIQGPDDLGSAAVGSIRGSAAEVWLDDSGIGFSGYPDVAAGLQAVADGEIDAFVYDRPLLRYLLKGDLGNDLRLVPGNFGRQDYGFALPQGSEMREPINRTILERIESRDWSNELTKVLGKQE